CQQNDKFPLTF
nr:immunoglobulin light chain junction region [Macaca mulatta]